MVALTFRNSRMGYPTTQRLPPAAASHTPGARKSESRDDRNDTPSASRMRESWGQLWGTGLPDFPAIMAQAMKSAKNHTKCSPIVCFSFNGMETLKLVELLA